MAGLNRAALLERARACVKSTQLLQARAICEELLKQNRRDVEAIDIQARIALMLGQHNEAVAALKKCMEFQPRVVGFRNELAGVYSTMGLFDQAIATYEAALRRWPDVRELIAGLAETLDRCGETEAAKKVLARVVKGETDDPVLGRVQALLCMSEGQPLRAVDVLQRTMSKGAVPISSLYLLGKAYEVAGDADRAFEAYTTANRHSQTPFNYEAHVQFYDSLIHEFTPENVARWPRARTDSTAAVIVTGRPRSGTTLVAKIIAAHPDAVDVGEITTFSEIADSFSFYIGSLAPYPAAIHDLDEHDANELSTKYLNEVRRLGGRAKRIVDKSLSNYMHLGLMQVLLPGARVINCTRDPVDNCLACYTEDLRGLHTYATDLRLLGLTHRQHERIMSHWHAVLDIPILDVAYEDVVADQARESRRVIEFLGLPWNDAVLRFYEAEKGAKRLTAAPTLSHRQVQKPIYKSSVGRAEKFRKHLGPLIDALEEGAAKYGVEASKRPNVQTSK